MKNTSRFQIIWTAHNLNAREHNQVSHLLRSTLERLDYTPRPGQNTCYEKAPAQDSNLALLIPALEERRVRRALHEEALWRDNKRLLTLTRQPLHVLLEEHVTLDLDVIPAQGRVIGGQHAHSLRAGAVGPYLQARSRASSSSPL